MRAHYFQHVPFEGLGSIENWLTANGYEIGCTRFFAPDFKLPAPDELDFLIVMGGPMSVNDENHFPWLSAEKNFLRRFIELRRPLLGICLGAQLIASALDSKVYPNPEKEIGWLDVNGVADRKTEAFQFPRSLQVFQWHGETFDLPAGATRLARSSACENQAFQFGKQIIALQFHLETTAASARALVDNCRDELLDGGRLVQSEEQILAVPSAGYDVLNREMSKVLDYLKPRP